MIAEFNKKKISGIVAILPERESFFDDEVGQYDFPESQTKKLKKIMGYEKHRLSKAATTPSDFCIFGLNYLLNNGYIKKEEIGAIVTVSVTPDYHMPHISNIIHGECGLSQETLCLDISQGCLGFILGLLESYMLLERLDDKKIILFNTDVLSHKTSPRDRNSFPIVGDATTVTVLENNISAGKSMFNIKYDGARREALAIPAGGTKIPHSEKTAEMVKDEEGNYRSLDNLRMDGTAVFQFVQRDVPPLIEETVAHAKIDKGELDYFLFHQPNKFMLQKLADRIGVPRKKVPMNIVERFGNPSGASIPLLIASNFGENITKNKYKVCMSAFGSGLAWGAMLTEIGEMDFCELAEADL